MSEYIGFFFIGMISCILYLTLLVMVLVERERVVRCRDCKFSFEGTNGKLDCFGPLTTSWDYQHDVYKENPVEPDGFCAWGERMDA